MSSSPSAPSLGAVQVVKGPVTKYLPLDCLRLGFSWAADKRVEMEEYVHELPDGKPIVFVVGAFAHGKIDAPWVSCDADGSPGVAYLSSFGGLASGVNCVRFSPSGEQVAVGCDGGELSLWHAVEEAGGAGGEWRLCGTLRGHGQDIHDLAWAPDGSALMSASVENVVVMWDVAQRRGVCRLDSHQHYVQGCAWDPRNGRLAASASADRTVKVFGPRARPGSGPPPSSAAVLKDTVVVASLSRRLLPGLLPAAQGEAAAGPGAGRGGAGASPPPAAAPPAAKHAALFLDEALPSFFRRLAWSPD
ncbi:WD_REPEATS_REGION domain-containing protein, partial [Haematococcus lacustris]